MMLVLFIIQTRAPKIVIFCLLSLLARASQKCGRLKIVCISLKSTSNAAQESGHVQYLEFIDEQSHTFCPYVYIVSCELLNGTRFVIVLSMPVILRKSA